MIDLFNALLAFTAIAGVFAVLAMIADLVEWLLD